MSPRACIGPLAIIATLASLQARPVAAALLQVPEEHATIAAALAAATYGDTVGLAVGSYFEHDLILPQGVSLIGRGSDPSACIIDAQQQGRVLYGVNLTRDNLVAELTLQNGLNSAPPWGGGGFHSEGDPAIESVIFQWNVSSSSGGGLYARGRPIIAQCIFSENSAEGGGGGRLESGYDGTWLIIADTVFMRNTARNGGGLEIADKAIRIERCSFHGNVAESSGGGLALVAPGDGGLLVYDSLISGNSAYTGGGIFCHANAHVRGCTIVGNEADLSYGGGGFISDSYYDLVSAPQLENCIVAFNTGGGISLYEYPQVDVVCCDVFGNTPANYVGWQYDHTGEDGTISTDPLFCANRGAQDYGLQANSPCLPANNDCGVLMGTYGQACPGTAVESLSWSKLKSLY